jgi:peptide/nickel transport system substrate-binding protein
LLDLLQRVPATSRRGFLKRSVAMGAAMTLGGSLLAACGGDDDDDDDGGDATEASGGGDATATTGRTTVPTPAGGGGSDASPTAAEGEDEEPTEEPEAGETPAGTGSEGEPVQGGTLILMGHEGVNGLSPDFTGPTVNWACITQIHNALVEMDPYFQYQPVLAESYEISDDGMEYTFTLREGVTFHDGEAFTADDVKYTMDYYGNPDNAMLTASDFVSIASTEVVDDLTVTITLNAPNAAFLTQGASAFIVPQHVHEPIGDAEYARAPIGTGAFKLAEYDPAAVVVMEANEDHFRGRPHLDAVRMDYVPEPSVRAIALETGDADSSVWSLATEDNMRLRDSGDFQVSITSSTAVNMMPMNHTFDQFKEKEVRQALMWALDRDTIVNDIWQGLAVKATTNLSPAIAYYHDDSEVNHYEYDPDMANQILDEAGWVLGDDGVRAKDGVRLAWDCAIIAGDQARRPIAEAAQQWFAEIGCEMSIVETTAITDDLRNGKSAMALFNWTYGGSGGDPDATAVLHSQFSPTQTHYSNPEMDEVLEAGLAEPDPEARKQYYTRMQQIFAEDVPVLYIQFWDWFTFFTPRVKGVPVEDALSGSQMYNMAHTFWIEEA